LTYIDPPFKTGKTQARNTTYSQLTRAQVDLKENETRQIASCQKLLLWVY